MTAVLLAYVVLVFAVTRQAVERFRGEQELEVDLTHARYRALSQERDQLQARLRELEDQAVRIFTMYTLLKDITRNFNEAEALETFQHVLRGRVRFDECRLLDPLSEEIPGLETDPDVFLFALKGQKRLLGYLAVRGLDDDDQDKAVILMNQFVLAMRRIRLYKEIERSAITDGLTDVFTRRHFSERLAEELRRARARDSRLSVLMLDVDYFKRINDRYGHLTGDQVLRRIGALLRENVREIDIVGRYGGEEFSVILPDTDTNDAAYVAGRIRAAVADTPIHAYDNALNVTVSIGLATFPQQADEPGDLVDKADWALYRAKKSGRNTVCLFDLASGNSG